MLCLQQNISPLMRPVMVSASYYLIPYCVGIPLWQVSQSCTAECGSPQGSNITNHTPHWYMCMEALIVKWYITFDCGIDLFIASIFRLQKHQYFITCGQSTWHHSIIWSLLVLMAEVPVSMATSKDHISQYVWSCDVNSFKYSVYRHLGILETVDQLRAGQYLSSLSYVDGSHLSIYGTVSGKNSYSKNPPC